MGINNSLLKSIQTLVDKAINIAPFDKTRQAQIITNNDDGTYTIRLDGVLYNNIPSYPNCSKLKVGIIVKTIIPSNQTSQMYIVAPEDARTFLDFFYPVGSYYETSNKNFNPNNEWGGTWVLEAEGKVHVSAGSSYVVGNTGGATTSTVPTTKLSNAQIAHGHGFTQPTVPKHTHGFTQPKIPNHKHNSDVSGKSYLYGLWKSGRAGQSGWNAGSGTAYYGYASLVTASDVNASGTTGNPSSLGSCTGGAVSEKAAVTCTGGAVSNLSGASDTRTAHGHGSVSTMQPYIVVNRWHRTA